MPRWRTCGSPTWLVGVRQQRHVLAEQVGLLDVHVARERTDRDVVAGVTDVRQVADAADVDQHRWLRQAQLHQWQQAVAAGEELGLVAVLADEGDRLLGGTGTDVVECCGDHCEPPIVRVRAHLAAAARTDWTMLW